MTAHRRLVCERPPACVCAPNWCEGEMFGDEKEDFTRAVAMKNCTLRLITIETIQEFPLQPNTKAFSRLEFRKSPSYRARSDRNKCGTAGKYLSVLKKNHICVHNNKKANQSRYRLSEVFLS